MERSAAAAPSGCTLHARAESFMSLTNMVFSCRCLDQSRQTIPMSPSEEECLDEALQEQAGSAVVDITAPAWDSSPGSWIPTFAASVDVPATARETSVRVLSPIWLRQHAGLAAQDSEQHDSRGSQLPLYPRTPSISNPESRLGKQSYSPKPMEGACAALDCDDELMARLSMLACCGFPSCCCWGPCCGPCWD